MTADFQSTIRYLMFGGETPAIDNPGALLEDMKRHCIVSLFGYGEYKLPSGFSETQRAQIKSLVSTQIFQCGSALREQDRLYELLAGIDVKPLVLKGFSAARYYPDPMLRTTGDIDFLIRGRLTVEHVADFLAENGYEIDDYKYSANERHIGINKNGVRFELHRYFSLRSCPYDFELDRIIDAAEPVECELQGRRFCSLPDAENGLVLLEHISHHICSSGLGFRQIIDWMCYVNSVLTDEFWDRSFKALAESTGLLTLAVHVTRMCELCFGLPERRFASAADESVCIRLADEIYKSGNFGRNYDLTVTLISGFTNSRNFFVRLQQGGLCRWEAARKHRILRPFAWLYQAFRILFIMLRPSSIKKLRSGNNLAKSRDSLYRSLGIHNYRGEPAAHS